MDAFNEKKRKLSLMTEDSSSDKGSEEIIIESNVEQSEGVNEAKCQFATIELHIDFIA